MEMALDGEDKYIQYVTGNIDMFLVWFVLFWLYKQLLNHVIYSIMINGSH